MQVLGVLIDGGSCLGAAIAFQMVELKRINTEFACNAFERDTVADLFSGVITHSFIVVFWRTHIWAEGVGLSIDSVEADSSISCRA